MKKESANLPTIFVGVLQPGAPQFLRYIKSRFFTHSLECQAQSLATLTKNNKKYQARCLRFVCIDVDLLMGQANSIIERVIEGLIERIAGSKRLLKVEFNIVYLGLPYALPPIIFIPTYFTVSGNPYALL